MFKLESSLTTMQNWHDIRYLLDGTKRQKAAYRALRFANIEVLLADFDPVLVGTIPLDIDIQGSDLDILLEIPDQFQFAQLVFPHFVHHKDFEYRHKVINDEDAWIVRFHAHGFDFELFAQQIPTRKQRAYRHMLVEQRLLEIGGDSAREAIRQLKQDGLKTEPAFAHYFGIAGNDPYETLLMLSNLDDDALMLHIG